eukprot:11198884-Lingulodinium_polyedra.AAC.1
MWSDVAARRSAPQLLYRIERAASPLARVAGPFPRNTERAPVSIIWRAFDRRMWDRGAVPLACLRGHV